MHPRLSAATPRLWVRPALLLLGGIALALVLWLVWEFLGAVAVLALSVLMAYWTSPLRTGPHTALPGALAAHDAGDAVILWAPGDPMSARLQTAIRPGRPGVTWVNVLRDDAAQDLLAQHGGFAALPLVLIGEQSLPRATVGQFLDAQAEERENGARPAA